MAIELFCIIADLVPGRFFRDKFMKRVFDAEFGIERVRRYWKTVFIRQYFPK